MIKRIVIGLGIVVLGFLGFKMTGNSPMAGATVLLEYQGGTSESTYRKGDMLYSSATNTLDRLASGSAGQCLTMNAGIPTWGACGSATPGGSNHAIQYNNNSSFGGFGSYSSASNLFTLTGNFVGVNASLSNGLEITNYASIGGNVTIAGNLTVDSGNHIYLHGLQALDTQGIHLHSANGTEIGFMGTANSANTTWNGTALYNGVTTDITTGTNENFTIAPNGTGITQITGNASVSANFEVGGTTSTSFGFINNYLDFRGLSTNPSAPAAGIARFHAFTTQGFTRFEQDNEAATNITLGRDSVFIARNTTVSTITKGQVVYVTGATGNVPNVALAKGDSLTTLPTIGVALDNINANAFGQIMVIGLLESFDTSSFSVGDSLYVSPTTAGALTNVRPAYPNYVAKIGEVTTSSVTGEILVDIAPFVGMNESGTNQTMYNFAGAASVATNFEVTGNASASKTFGSGLSACSGTSFLQWTAGVFGCATPSGSAFSGLLMHEGAGTTPHITDLTYDANMFNFSNVASAGTLKLDWTNGPASRSATQTITGAWTFSAGGTGVGSITLDNGDTGQGIVLTGTSAIGSYTVTFPGAAGTICLTATCLPLTGGTLTGNLIGTNASFSTGFDMTGTTSSSFGGSLDVTKGIHSATWITAIQSGFGLIGSVVKALVSLVIPNSANPTIAATNNLAVDTASASLSFYDGATAKSLHNVCKTFVVDAPTASNPSMVGPIRFNDPFTITSVQSVASGSNSASWNLVYGAPGTLTTSVFTADKKASTSSYPTYTTFANSTLTDGQALAVKITSKSAVLQTFSVSVCGYYPDQP